MVLLFGLPEVPAFCSWVVALQALWFFAASLCVWEGHICPSFLVLFGSPLELSQSHFGCAARPRDLGPNSFYWTLFGPLILASWALFFLPSISWALKTYPFMDFGLQIFWAYHPFLLWAQPLFNFTFHGLVQCAISLGLVSWFFRSQQIPKTNLRKVGNPIYNPLKPSGNWKICA